MNTGLDADLDSSRFVLRVCAPGSSGCFPSADASDRYCRRFAKVICRALPPAMQDRIVYGDGASLRITQFIDGTVTAETSDINTEPSAADQRPKPGAGEIAVILAKSPAPWGASSEDDSSAVSWQGILALKGLTA
jgi:hypothetical protein